MDKIQTEESIERDFLDTVDDPDSAIKIACLVLQMDALSVDSSILRTY